MPRRWPRRSMRTAPNIARLLPARDVLAALLLMLIAACGSPSAPPVSMAVGTVADPESILLANLYAAALRSYGTPAHVVEVGHPLSDLDAGKVSVVPGFTGRLLQTFAPGAAARSDEQVYRSMVGVLPEGVAAGDYTTAAQDKPAAVITGATAGVWGSRDLSALVKRCADIRSGMVADTGPPATVGGCALPKPREFPDREAMFNAVRAGQIDVGWTSTADPDLPDDLVVLTDRKPMLIQAQNVVPLYRRNELSPRQVLAVNEIAGVLDTAALKQMRRQVADGADPRAVAEGWLSEHPLGR